MRRLKVEYQPQAIGDLGEIYRYVLLRSQNRIIAQEFVRRIKSAAARLALSRKAALFVTIWKRE
jgi:plasmid stabilization system protein ParE